MSELKELSPNQRQIKFEPHEIAKELNSHADPWNLVNDKTFPIAEELREGGWCILLRGIHTETLLYVHPQLKLLIINSRSKDEQYAPLSLYITDEVKEVHVVEPDESRPEKSISLTNRKGDEVVIFEGGRYRIDNTAKRKKYFLF